MNKLFAISSSILSLGLTATAFAAELGSEYTSLICPLNIPDRPHIDATLTEDDIFMKADEVDLIEDGYSTLMGRAEMARNRQQATADRIEYNASDDTANLVGNVSYWDEDLFLKSKDAFLQFDNGVGNLSTANYILKESRGRGTAETMVLDIGTRTDMEKTDYTTCDPDNQFWQFIASSLSLDHENNQGKARHAILRIKNIPVFYTPYISFPLSKARKSGFLTPAYGTTSRNGFEFRTPYYWNISPARDATLTPRFLTDSGVMAIGEYRYLHTRGQGEINIEYLPGDNARDGKHRNFIDLKLSQRFAGTGNIFATYSRVSDKFYFEDFGSQLSAASTSFLEQRLDFSYAGTNWNILARVQNFQTVDRSIPATSRPYKRLPQIVFNYHRPKKNNALNYGLKGEAVYFDRGDNIVISNGIQTNNSVNGLRLDLKPYVSFPMTTKAAFIKPKLGFNYTQYSLEDNILFKSSPNRVLPIFSLDSGIFFERNTRLLKTDFMQTLEPRLYYLFIPNDKQDDLPVFDTGQYTFSFSSLFYENRFSGTDRMGDANQITLALTSRLINQTTGKNVGQISLGQKFFLRDRKVTLPGRAIRDEGSSAFVASAKTTLIDHWNISGNIQWNPNNTQHTERLTARAIYRPGAGKILNFSYRMIRDVGSIEQSDISLRWPFGRNWSVVGRWNYAIPQGRSLELFGGIEYEHCCWSFRAVARRFLTSINGEFDTGLFLQMELKGVASIGRKTVGFLKQQIPGYQNEF